MIKQVHPKFMFTVKDVTTAVYHAGEREGSPKHSHNYDHAILCANGSCIVRKENKLVTLNKNSQPVLLTAPDWHEIEALEDGTVFITTLAAGEEVYNEVVKTE